MSWNEYGRYQRNRSNGFLIVGESDKDGYADILSTSKYGVGFGSHSSKHSNSFSRDKNKRSMMSRRSKRVNDSNKFDSKKDLSFTETYEFKDTTIPKESFIPSVSLIFKLALCVILIGVFTFKTYSDDVKVLFGDYAGDSNIINVGNYELSTGDTIDEYYKKFGFNNTLDDNGDVIIDFDTEFNVYAWDNKLKKLSRLKNIFNDGLLPNMNKDIFLDARRVPSPEDVYNFGQSYTFHGAFESFVLKGALEDGTLKMYYDPNIGYWQVVKGSSLSVYENNRTSIIRLNKHIIDDNINWVDYAKAVLIFPVNMISNLFYDIYVFIDFIKDWS